ncbi:PAS domain S-box protein [Zunongwangia sp. H14]|uniref:PAS domain S-box protein n=1 Tax=Zunongwangia sp. H14 TaxID=3240792 RepID=UPI0035645EEA
MKKYPKAASTAKRSFVTAIVDTVKEPVVVIHKSGEILSANPSFYNVFKLEESPEEEVYLANFPFFAELEVRLQEITSEEKLKDVRIAFQLNSEITKIFLVNAAILEGEELAKDLILVSFYPPKISFNSTEDESAKDDLKNIRKILSQTPAMICVLRGPNHIFDFANDKYLKLTGNRNILGKPVREALPEIESQGFLKILDKVYSSGKVFIGNELQINLETGQDQLKNSYLNFVYQPVLNNLGEVSGIFVHAVDVTENVMARKKLEESEHELRKVIDTVPAIIWITEPGGKNSYLNKKWYEYTGQSVEESSNYGWLNALHPEERLKVKAAFKKANKRQEDYSATFRVRNREGKYRWVLDSGSPKYGSDGSYEGMIGTVVDIHEDKIKEQLVREKEHRIRSIIEEATVATAIYTGRDMKIEVANDAMIKLWGKDHSVIGSTLREALPELEGQPFHNLLQMVYTTGDTYWGKEDPVDLVIDNKLQTGYFNFTYKALRNEKGVIYGILNMAIDVTEMVKSKELLKQSESRFRQLADLMPEKVAGTDAEGNFTYFNQSWLEYTGLNNNELISRGWSNSIHPEEKEAFYNNWQLSLKSGKDFEMEFRYLNEKNKYKWHLSRAEAIKDENGNIKMWICTATEIQKLKAEEKRKEDFLKMVSHELKTPLTSMKGYVQLLLSLLQTEEEADLKKLPVKKYLERVDHQMGRLTRLISEMLDLSRIEKNKLELKKETFSLNDLILETIQDIKYTNSGHSITFSSEYNCEINGDKDRIGQVLINLITNAIKYSPVNHQIEVSIKKLKGEKVGVSVKDSGIGIGKENQKKIFKRFYRVDGNNEETYSGFGIGLYLAKEIIRRHRGTLVVKSEMGKGSVFTFTLAVAG